MRALIWILAVGFAAFSCGEAGFQLNVGKDVPYVFEVDADLVNENAREFDGQVTIDLGDQELGEYDLAELDMNSITYEIVGLPTGQTYGRFAMEIVINGSQTLVTIPNLVLTNTNAPVPVFPNGVVEVNFQVVENMRNIIVSGSSFELFNFSTFEEDVPNDFQIIFNFDVLGKVRP